MAKHQLSISRDMNLRHPVRSEAGQSKATSMVVVNWKGTWESGEQSETYLVVAPQDEIEIVLSSGEEGGSSVWFFDQLGQKVPLLRPQGNPWGILHPLVTWIRSLWNSETDGEQRVDIKSGSKVVQLNQALAGDSREFRYYLRISELGERPPRIGGQGQAGTLTASKP
ncbi:hypothetical protein F0U59_18085 [Archangium gephyra]|nr:hypothetical protein F0U59_18085 [Archangium gephyra]